MAEFERECQARGSPSVRSRPAPASSAGTSTARSERGSSHFPGGMPFAFGCAATPSKQAYRPPKIGYTLTGLPAVPSMNKVARPAAHGRGRALETSEPNHSPLDAIALMEFADPMSGRCRR